MIDSKQVGGSLFRVVDRRGNIHEVQAGRMLTDGFVVTFHHGVGPGGEIASFGHPIGVSRVDVSTYTETLNLAPGEACLAAFPAAPRGLVVATCVVAAAIAVSVVLKVYELFLFAG